LKTSGTTLWFGRVASTNDVAKEFARAGAGHGTAVVADEQTRGRGTKGRAWHSPAGQGLYVSFILKPTEGLELAAEACALLPFAVGVGTVEAVRSAAGVAAGLKWPNDIVWEKKKLGGILVETVFSGARLQFAVAGIGLNLSQRDGDFPEEIRGRAVSLLSAAGRPVARRDILAGLHKELDCWYNRLISDGNSVILEAYEERLAFARGGIVSVTLKEGVVAGVFRGLDAAGRLVIEARGARRAVAFEDTLGVDWE
jgi:BirA family biotin operon repressor/biotin-[acetyl-CoA-carboxylase] ligase